MNTTPRRVICDHVKNCTKKDACGRGIVHFEVSHCMSDVCRFNSFTVRCVPADDVTGEPIITGLDAAEILRNAFPGVPS